VYKTKTLISEAKKQKLTRDQLRNFRANSSTEGKQKCSDFTLELLQITDDLWLYLEQMNVHLLQYKISLGHNQEGDTNM